MTKYRIQYRDTYHCIKSLVYEADTYSKVCEFAKTLGHVVNIEILNANTYTNNQDVPKHNSNYFNYPEELFDPGDMD